MKYRGEISALHQKWNYAIGAAQTANQWIRLTCPFFRSSCSIAALQRRVAGVLFVCLSLCLGFSKSGPQALEQRISPLHTRIAASRRWDSCIILSLLRRSSGKKLAETLTDERATWADRQRSERQRWLWLIAGQEFLGLWLAVAAAAAAEAAARSFREWSQPLLPKRCGGRMKERRDVWWGTQGRERTDAAPAKKLSTARRLPAGGWRQETERTGGGAGPPQWDQRCGRRGLVSPSLWQSGAHWPWQFAGRCRRGELPCPSPHLCTRLRRRSFVILLLPFLENCTSITPVGAPGKKKDGRRVASLSSYIERQRY